MIVYIHGGGNFSGGTPDYDASKLARAGNVVVTIAYRLNLMGFLAHPALDREKHSFANYGLLDQQAALKWVRRNIQAFGGDPLNVTLGGQSNGGYDALLHMVSPLARGLFHKAISQSGTRVIFDRIPSLQAAEANGIALAVAAGCGAGIGPEVAKCLRDLPAERIEELAGTALDRSKFVINTAIVDGTVIREQPIASFRSGRFSHVPLMIGTTTDERNFFAMIATYWAIKNAGSAPKVTAEDYNGFIADTFAAPSYVLNAPERISRRYPLTAFPSPQAAIGRLSSDATICIARRFSALLAPRVPVFAYEFADRTAPSYFPPAPGMETGAYHSAELQYLFPLWHGGPNGIAMPLSNDQLSLAELITRSIANFARTGDPTASQKQKWPSYSRKPGQRPWLLQAARAFSTLSDLQYAQMHSCDFWDSISSP